LHRLQSAISRQAVEPVELLGREPDRIKLIGERAQASEELARSFTEGWGGDCRSISSMRASSSALVNQYTGGDCAGAIGVEAVDRSRNGKRGCSLALDTCSIRLVMSRSSVNTRRSSLSLFTGSSGL
jgi:hypothetical protein